MQLEPAQVVAPPGAVVPTRWDDGVLRWRVANETASPLVVDRVQVRLRLSTRGPLRAFRHGWQSWSPTGGGRLTGAADPATDPAAPSLARRIYHADDSPPPRGYLRSELVTLLADDDEAVCLGFDGGDRHDGTFHLGAEEVVVEAYLGGAALAPGEVRELHAVRVRHGDPARLLDDWAGWAGAAAAARRDAPFVVGWCSWYHYFHGVTEQAVRDNLARASEWPFELFQLDDGYQAAVGDWLRRAPSFPSPLDGLAAEIAARGQRPGIWIAPFLVAPGSELAREHPDWLVRRASGRPLVGMVNPGWGGEQYVLDTTRAEVLAHLEALARELVAMGWTYLKLDFTYAPALAAEWADRAATPAQRVRAGYEAIRSGAGDDAFLLGCGAPLGPCVGVVDGMRIGPDVAPYWSPGGPAGYADAAPATVNAWRNTLARSFQHRRLWLNDPDCLLLRSTRSDLTAEQVRAWAYAVAASGGDGAGLRRAGAARPGCPRAARRGACRRPGGRCGCPHGGRPGLPGPAAGVDADPAGQRRRAAGRGAGRRPGNS